MSGDKPVHGDEGDTSPQGAAPLISAEESLRQRLKNQLKDVIPATAGQSGSLVERVSSIAVEIIKEEYFQGPLPPPKQYADYEVILPGSANRILAMAENEQAHRHGLENRTLNFDFLYSIAGLFLGSVVAAALVAGAFFSAIKGHDIIAGGFLATSAVGMVPAFVRGRELFKNDTKS